MEVIIFTKKSIKNLAHVSSHDCENCNKQFKLEPKCAMIVPPQLWYAPNIYFCKDCVKKVDLNKVVF